MCNNIKKFLLKAGLYHILLEIKYRLADRLLKRSNYIYAPQGLKTKFYIPLIKTDLIQRGIYATKTYYELFSLNFVTKEFRRGVISDAIKNGSVLDIGANIGNHTLYFLKECDAKFVYCFEPARETFEILKKNIYINDLGNRTYLINAGVGACSGKGLLKSVEGNTGFTKLEPSENGEIQILAIDDMEFPSKVGLVKIDVEGFEVEVLKGMTSTLKRDKPFIMIEIDKDNYIKVCSILENIGYQHIAIHQHAGSTDNHLFYYI